MFVLFDKFNKIGNVLFVNLIILICEYMCLLNGMDFLKELYEEEKLYSFVGYIIDCLNDICDYK